MRVGYRLALRSRRRLASRARRRLLESTRRSLRPWHRITLFSNHWRKCQAIISAWQPDAVHSCDLEGLVGAARAARRLGIPHIHDCHELFLERPLFTDFEKKVLGAVERRAIRRPSIVTVVNQSIGAELGRRYGISTLVVRNCVNAPESVETRDVRMLADLPPDMPVVLYQGGLLEGRGLPEMILAVREFPEACALVVLGFGRMREELELLARTTGVEDRVCFVDAVPPDELLPLTASATIGLIPYQPISLNNKLALPNKIFEYLSVGLPVAASDIPELRNVVVGERCGAVFDPFDPSSIAGAVRTLLDPANLPTVRAAALQYGSVNTWERERMILLDAYERLLTT